MTTISVRTSQRCELVDVTDKVAHVVRESGVERGLVVAYVAHTTAGITINENADPSVQHDILLTLDALVPRDRPGYRHAEGNSDAHLKASLVGSISILLSSGITPPISSRIFIIALASDTAY